ncbi:MLP-like protein 34 [Chenopodium quinoa]|uniref:MLP-like protein 34 n=1 Tax=Chenopodium quinoa TaxID=63459 RepID=UPI000B77C61F|nr:MLP-like protein 34 [Chenopodium quinoa]
MAQLHRNEGQIELNCEAEKFFDIWAHKMYLISNMSPNKIQKSVLNEGEWDKVGAVITGSYVINETGERATLKARIDEIDEKNRTVKYSYHDGFIMEKYYKSFTATMQATPKSGNKGCIITWCFEYEKMNDDAPNANMYLDFMLSMANDMDAHLCM